MKRKSKALSYILWFIGIFGLLGFHRFYLGKIGTGIIWMFSAGLLGIGAAYDLITLGNQVDIYNQGEKLDAVADAHTRPGTQA